jgi:L-fuculose-phosphate aldolase
MRRPDRDRTATPDARHDPGDTTFSLRKAVSDGARAVAESGLVVGTAGNVSVRIGEDMLITPRGSDLARIDPDDCVRVRIENGAVRSGAEPSSETPFHRVVYGASQAGAIVHTHSHFATVLSTLVDELPAVHYGVMAFGGRVRVAPYATFGTDELAESVGEALRGRCAALLANHGAVVTADTVASAVDLAVQLEWLASVTYYAMLAGTPAVLGDAALEQAVEQKRVLGSAAKRPR